MVPIPRMKPGTKQSGRDIIMSRLYEISLQHDAKGRIVRKEEKTNGKPVVWEYDYDQDGRLVRSRRDGCGAEEYIYDRQGRRSEECNPLRGKGCRRFTYDRDNRLLSAGDARFEHDFDGFRCSRITPSGTTRYAYAPDYRLEAVRLPDGRHISYGHNEDGLRAVKYVKGKLVAGYAWKDRFHLTGWHDGERLWCIDYDRLGLPVAMRSSDLHFNFCIDQIGSVVAVAEHSGNMVKEIRYDSFGNIIRDTNPRFRIPFGFAGGLADSDTGLVRFGWRDYDPDTGRWTAKDPIGNAGGDPDWYGYCLDDPINAVDLTGLDSQGIGIGGSLSGFGAKAGGSVMISQDDNGHRVLELSSEYGASSGFGADFTGTYQRTNAESVDQISGTSGKAGASVGPPTIPFNVGMEKVSGDGYDGENYNISYGVDLTPVSTSVTREDTTTFSLDFLDDFF